jgi:hypothetical protein
LCAWRIIKFEIGIMYCHIISRHKRSEQKSSLARNSRNDEEKNSREKWIDF